MKKSLEKYGSIAGGCGTREQAEATLAKVHPMTLGALKNGETAFFAAEVMPHPHQEGKFIINYAAYRAFAADVVHCPGYYSGGKAIRGIQEAVPAALIRIFPELGDENFFVADIEHVAAKYGDLFLPDPNVKWVCEFLEENQIRRWKLPAVADLSTRQIVALMELRSELDKNRYGHAEYLKLHGVEFGTHVDVFEEAAVKVMIQRSLESYPNYLATQATAWLAENFDKSSYAHVEWLRRVIFHDGFCRLRERFPQSTAVKFAETSPITGEPEQWGFLPAIPADRKEICLSYAGDSFYLPDGEAIPVTKALGGSYFRVREDGRTDLFLRRGSRELGNKGWMWVLINPHAPMTYEIVEAAIDPLDNYAALQETYTPLFARITQAYALAHGGKQLV